MPCYCLCPHSSAIKLDGNGFNFSACFSELQRRWKEELVEELERKRGKSYVIFCSSITNICFVFLVFITVLVL